MTKDRPSSARSAHQTESEIENVLRQLVPESESPAPRSEPLAPKPEPLAPRKMVNLARFGPAFKLIVAAAFLVVGARCAYVEHELSAVTNEAALTKAEARACEQRMLRRIPGDAADDRRVRSDLDEVTHQIRGVGPIHQTAPGVFTNRDPDPAEMSPR